MMKISGWSKGILWTVLSFKAYQCLSLTASFLRIVMMGSRDLRFSIEVLSSLYACHYLRSFGSLIHWSPYLLAAYSIALILSMLTSLHSISWKLLISLITSEYRLYSFFRFVSSALVFSKAGYFWCCSPNSSYPFLFILNWCYLTSYCSSNRFSL